MGGLWRKCVIRIDRWSEERSCFTLQEEQWERSGEAKEMSDDVWLILMLSGFRVDSLYY